MSYRIDEIEGIGPSYASKLGEAGIKTTRDLLKRCCDAKGRRQVSSTTGLGEQKLLEWANMADLMRISGIGKQFSELLEASGIDTVKELRTRNVDNLAKTMAEINRQKRLTRNTPSASMVRDWVAQAKTLEPLITH